MPVSPDACDIFSALLFLLLTLFPPLKGKGREKEEHATKRASWLEAVFRIRDRTD